MKSKVMGCEFTFFAIFTMPLIGQDKPA